MLGNNLASPMPEIPPLGEMSRSDKRGAVSAGESCHEVTEEVRNRAYRSVLS